MTAKLKPVGPNLVLNQPSNNAGGKAGSFTIKGKTYRIDSLELTEFGGTAYKKCSTDSLKMQEIAKLIETAVRAKIDSGELDPSNLPDDLHLEFSRKQMYWEPRSQNPIFARILPNKRVENRHHFDKETEFTPSKLWYTGADKKPIELAVDDLGTLGKDITDQITEGVQFSKPSKKEVKKQPIQHIPGFGLATVRDGDCAVDAALQGLRQKDSEGFKNVHNNDFRNRASQQIRNTPLFSQDGIHFDSICQALREARTNIVRRMAGDNRWAAIRSFLDDSQPINDAGRAQIVAFYADYIALPTVWMDHPFFLAIQESGTPVVILERSADGNQNPGYEVRYASNNATAENALFVTYNGTNHYLAVDHSGATLERRQAIMANYARP